MALSTTDMEFVTKLRQMVGQTRACHTDLAMLHWLKAHNMDLEATAASFKKSNEFLSSLKLGEYTSPKVISDYYAGGFCGYAKDGSAITIKLLGHLDMKGIMRSTSKSDLERFKMNDYEKAAIDVAERSKKDGAAYYGITTVLDMSGVGTEWLWRPGLQMYIHLVNLLEDNYPGSVLRILVINAPGIFPLLWRIVRGFMKENLKSKLEVLKSKDGLLEYIDKEQLPVFLGGTMKDEDDDPFCSSRICPGGKVPDTYYLSDPEYLKTMTFKEIPCGQKFTISFEVDAPGAILSWAFRTESNDIGFGVVYKSGGEDDSEDLIYIPQKRVASHVLMEDGSITCAKPGTYEICFDNSYSWTVSKRLYYQAEIHVTDGTILQEVNHFTQGGDWKLVADRA